METRASHVLIGAFTLAVLLLGMLFALWIGKASLDREWDRYDIVFTEAVTGLTSGGAVQYNGIQVGEVSALTLDPDDPRLVIAQVRLRGGTPVRADTRAKLAITGLTGVAVIQLSGGTPDAPRLVSDDPARPPRIVADESALQKLLSSSEDIATTTSEVLLRINRLLSPETLDRIARTVDNLERISAAVASEDRQIASLLRDAADAAAQLKRTTALAERSMARLDAGLVRLDESLLARLPQIGASLERSMASLERFSANADGLLRDNRAALDGLAQSGLGEVGPALMDLRALLNELSQLSAQLRDDAAGTVLGRNQPKEFTPE